MMPVNTVLSGLIRSLRPEQWLKNGFVLAPLVFAGRFGDAESWRLGLLAVISFCAAASATYLVNDLSDRGADREHPLKRMRPIASGLVSPALAILTAVGLLVVAGALAAAIGGAFLSVIGGYVLLTLLYSLVLKRLVFVDVLVVAVGFVLRVVGGATAIRVPVSHWLLLCAYLLALYLALGKRRSEMVLLGEEAGNHRAVLGAYSLELVDQSISVVLGATVVAYALYTVAPGTVAKVGSDWLIATVPLVLYGLFRYLYLLHRHELGGSPTRALLTDVPLALCVLLWLAVAGTVISFR